MCRYGRVLVATKGWFGEIQLLPFKENDLVSVRKTFE